MALTVFCRTFFDRLDDGFCGHERRDVDDRDDRDDRDDSDELSLECAETLRLSSPMGPSEVARIVRRSCGAVATSTYTAPECCKNEWKRRRDIGGSAKSLVHLPWQHESSYMNIARNRNVALPTGFLPRCEQFPCHPKRNERLSLETNVFLELLEVEGFEHSNSPISLARSLPINTLIQPISSPTPDVQDTMHGSK